MLRKYEVELKRLKDELNTKARSVIDHEVVYQLEEDKKRLEEDREAAIIALEVRSKEFLNEKEEKKRLEEKIRTMNSQMLQGGH